MSAAKKKDSSGFKEIRNSKAFHKYHVGEKFEAGISLQGTEVKSIRAGKAQITEAFVRIEGTRAILYHAHIDEYAFGSDNNHNPVRPRQLLLHKKEIEKLRHAVEAEGSSLIPIRMYFKGSLVKIEIAVCKGKKLFDKREDIKRRVTLREAERYIKGQRR